MQRKIYVDKKYNQKNNFITYFDIKKIKLY